MEIPEGCLSPYLYDILKKKDDNENNNDNIQTEIIEEKPVNTEILPSNTNNNELNVNQINSVQNENKIDEQKKYESLINNEILRKINNYKTVKRFVDCNWNCDDELSFPKYHELNCKI